MMKNKTRFFALLLAAVMCLSATAMAYEPQYTGQAGYLQTAGLFRGTAVEEDGSARLDLDKQATRMQGLIMLIRLLGEEEAALAYTGACPFTDLSGNAARYAAYAYAKGYTTGQSATTFGNTPLQANAFLTFTLRALGYDDKQGDFSYAAAHQKAAEIGLIQAGEYSDPAKTFLRDDCAYIAFNALGMQLKGSDKRLAEVLNDKNVLSDMLTEDYWYIRLLLTPVEEEEPVQETFKAETLQIAYDFAKEIESRDGYYYDYILEYGTEIFEGFVLEDMWENVEILKTAPESSFLVAGYFREYENGMYGKGELTEQLAYWLIWNGDDVDSWYE